MKSLSLLVLFAAIIVSLPAVEVPFIDGEPIDVAVHVSTNDNKQPRTVRFFTDIDIYTKQPDATGAVSIQKVRGSIIVTLKKNILQTQVHVFTADGRVFILNIHPAQAHETFDPEIILVDGKTAQAKKTAKSDEEKPYPTDTYSSLVKLTDIMYTGREDSRVISGPISTTVDNKVVLGNVVHESDLLKVTAIRSYLAPNMLGIVVKYEWFGEKPVTINLQALQLKGQYSFCPIVPVNGIKNRVRALTSEELEIAPTLTLDNNYTLFGLYVCELSENSGSN